MEKQQASDDVDEREAIEIALAIIRWFDPKGNTDFDRGMRTLQERLGLRPPARKRKPRRTKKDLRGGER